MKGAAVLNCKLRVVKVPPDFLMRGRFLMTSLALNSELRRYNGIHLHKDYTVWKFNRIFNLQHDVPLDIRSNKNTDSLEPIQTDKGKVGGAFNEASSSSTLVTLFYRLLDRASKKNKKKLVAMTIMNSSTRKISQQYKKMSSIQ